MATKTITYDATEYPVIHAFYKSARFISCIMGPFGSGKTSACLFKIIRLARFQKPDARGIRRVRWAVTRNTYTQLRDTTLKSVKEWLPPASFGRLRGGDVGPWNFIITGIKGLEIELMFRALDRPDHVKNLLSLELTGAWMNEYREIHKDIFEALQGRVGRFPSMKDEGCTWAGIIGDTNPPDEGEYWHKFFEEDCPENAELFKQPSGLDPAAENITHLRGGREYYTNLAIGKDKEFVDVYIHGRYGATLEGEAVTPEYNEQFHRSEKQQLEPVKGFKAYRLWDGGLHPCCVIWQVIHGRVLQLDTFLVENRGMKQLITTMVQPAMATRYKDIEEWEDYGDPTLATPDNSDSDGSPAQVIEKELNTTFRGGTNNWEARRSAVKTMLSNMVNGKPQFCISRHDVISHKALRGGWHYNTDVHGKPTSDKPVKDKHSHPGDCIAYGATSVLGLAQKTSKRSVVKSPSTRSYV